MVAASAVAAHLQDNGIKASLTSSGNTFGLGNYQVVIHEASDFERARQIVDEFLCLPVASGNDICELHNPNLRIRNSKYWLRYDLALIVAGVLAAIVKYFGGNTWAGIAFIVTFSAIITHWLVFGSESDRD